MMREMGERSGSFAGRSDLAAELVRVGLMSRLSLSTRLASMRCSFYVFRKPVLKFVYMFGIVELLCSLNYHFSICPLPHFAFCNEIDIMNISSHLNNLPLHPRTFGRLQGTSPYSNG